MRIRSVGFLSVVLLLAVAGSLPALTIEMPVSELTAQADVIVSGTVASLYSHWDEEHNLIYTDVTITPESYEKGMTDNAIVVRVPGGEVDDIGLAVEDVPVFVTGQKAKLYLARNAYGSVYDLVGGGQGAIMGGGSQYYSYTGYHRASPNCNYYVNSVLPSDWVAAIQAGDATWDAAGSNFRYNYLGSTTKTAPILDGINVIWLNDLGSNGTIAANYYWYNRRTKIVSENDIIFNSRLPWSTTGSPGAFDVQDIITHEMGHCLVLNDLYRSYQSEQTMYGYASQGETKKRTLESGDIAGIKLIYGSGFDGVAPHKSAGAGIAK